MAAPAAVEKKRGAPKGTVRLGGQSHPFSQGLVLRKARRKLARAYAAKEWRERNKGELNGRA